MKLSNLKLLMFLNSESKGGSLTDDYVKSADFGSLTDIYVKSAKYILNNWGLYFHKNQFSPQMSLLLSYFYHIF